MTHGKHRMTNHLEQLVSRVESVFAEEAERLFELMHWLAWAKGCPSAVDHKGHCFLFPRWSLLGSSEQIFNDSIQYTLFSAATFFSGLKVNNGLYFTRMFF